VLPELKKEWWEALESKKWSDRKGSLTQLKELCTYPRLASGRWDSASTTVCRNRPWYHDTNLRLYAPLVHCRDVDYGDVNRELRKVITKDSNVACVAEAISVCAAMASGLRSAYSATAKGLVEVCAWVQQSSLMPLCSRV
jgi:cytoskeleton-associated protein 5